MSKQKQKNKQFVYKACSESVLSLEFSCTELAIQWTINLLSYYWLVDARISTSEKDLPVSNMTTSLKKLIFDKI